MSTQVNEVAGQAFDYVIVGAYLIFSAIARNPQTSDSASYTGGGVRPCLLSQTNSNVLLTSPLFVTVETLVDHVETNV